MLLVDCSSEVVQHQCEPSDSFTTVYQRVFPVLIAAGILANLVNLAVLTRPSMNSKIYRWLRVLAAVDVLLCVFTVPVCLAGAGHQATSHALAYYHAHFGWTLSMVFQIISFYLMSWFAFDRYLAVCCHLQYAASQTDTVLRLRVVITCVAVVVLYLPTMIVGQVCSCRSGWKVGIDGYSSVIDDHAYIVYTWIREVFSRIVPGLLITFCNVKIVVRLKQLRNTLESFGSGVPPARRERERRLVLLLFWITAFFYVYNIPVTVYYLGVVNHEDFHEKSFLEDFSLVANLLQLIGNITNFILYFFITPEFQRTFMNMFRCRWPVQENELNCRSESAVQTLDTRVAHTLHHSPPSGRHPDTTIVRTQEAEL